MNGHAHNPELEDRHARLFAQLSTPVTPAALRGPRALEDIFERANRHAEERMDSGVRSSLQAQFSAAEAAAEVRGATAVLPSAAEIIASESHLVSPVAEPLRSLETVEAPGIIWPRVRADLVEWRASRKLAQRRRRTLSIVSAVAAVLVVSLLFTQRGVRPTDELMVSAVDAPAPQIRFVGENASSGGLATTRAIADAIGTPMEAGFDAERFAASRGGLR